MQPKKAQAHLVCPCIDNEGPERAKPRTRLDVFATNARWAVGLGLSEGRSRRPAGAFLRFEHVRFVLWAFLKDNVFKHRSHAVDDPV